MRNIFVMILALSGLIAIDAGAVVLKCEKNSKSDYLLALTDESGLIFTNENGFFLHNKGKVGVARALDSARLIVSFNPEDERPEIDWKKEPRCWVFGPSSMRFRINIISDTEIEATVQGYPHIIIDPDKSGCRLPHFQRPPPWEIKCTQIK